MERLHDTMADIGRGTPAWFLFSARLLPVGILGQFLSAGLALFGGNNLWGLHAGIGGTLSLLVVALLAGAMLVPRLRGFGWWAGLTFVLYGTQVMLAAGSVPVLISLHPLNGALLLGAASVLLFKIERRVAARKCSQSSNEYEAANFR
jgi:hypothetical protein